MKLKEYSSRHDDTKYNISRMLTHCGILTPYADIWVNNDSDNGLVPDGTKSLPEPMLTNNQ